MKRSWVDAQLDDPRVARAAFEETFKEYTEALAALRRKAATLKARAEDDYKHMTAVREEQGRRRFYDKVRNALGKYNPEGDVTEDDLCAAIALLAKAREGVWGVWKLGQSRWEPPLFTGTRDDAMTWAKEHHADAGPYHVRETIKSLEAQGLKYE